MHFSLSICHLVATISVIFLRTNWPNFVHFILIVRADVLDCCSMINNIYWSTVPAQKYLPERRSAAFQHHYTPGDAWWVGGTTGSASDQQSTNQVAGLRPTKVVCITVMTGNHEGWTARCGRPPLLLPSSRKLEFRLSAMTDSDLAWVKGKSARLSCRYADAFQRSIILEAIYHFTISVNRQRRK